MQDTALIITGAASGVGRAIAVEAVAQGAREVLLTDVDGAGLEDTARRLNGVATIEADLSEAGAAETICAAAKAQFGRIDGLANAAGVTTRASFLDGSADAFDRIFAINTRAPYLLMSAAIADMRARGAPGAIVNIQSINAHCGHPDLAIYSASKGALQTLTRNAANAHMADGIRVNGINLGWTWTETEDALQRRVVGPDWEEAAKAGLPLGRLLNVEEVAAHTAYLLGPASAPLTGACIDLEQSVVGAPR